LTPRARFQYARSVKKGWPLTAILCATTAIVGYSAASRRASALETFLDRMSLEQDSCRAVTAEQAYMLERVTDARMSDEDVGEVARLRAQLDQTAAFLNDARSVADERSRAYESQHATLLEKDTALHECSDVQGRLEQQLESCIFEKAALEKRAKAGPDPTALRPKSGNSAFTQSIEFPATAGD
jgi:chromosome segregation ATPase